MLERLAFVTPYLPWLALASVGSLVLAAALLPAIVLKLPSDYFVRDRRAPVIEIVKNPLASKIFTTFKNFIGVLFVIAGIAMLVLPGQGLLTILIGLMLTNFPGKFRLEKKIIRQPSIAQTLNGLRGRAGKAPFEIPSRESAG